MKLSFVPILALVAALPALALPEPVAAPAVEFEKRDTTCVVSANSVSYRTCPRITAACGVVGTYPRGTHITARCYTETNTTPVNGDR